MRWSTRSASKASQCFAVTAVRVSTQGEHNSCASDSTPHSRFDAELAKPQTVMRNHASRQRFPMTRETRRPKEGIHTKNEKRSRHQRTRTMHLQVYINQPQNTGKP